MSSKAEATSSGIGFFGLLTIVFVTMKLMSWGAVANWSWWYVLGPLWMPTVAGLTMIMIAGIIALMTSGVSK